MKETITRIFENLFMGPNASINIGMLLIGGLAIGSKVMDSKYVVEVKSDSTTIHPQDETATEGTKGCNA